MAYSQTNWQDNETPISAANMNKIETGISNAHATIDAATSAATPGTIARRDANGRMKAAAPSASDDVALKSTVDTHAAITTAPIHGSTSAATINTLMHRDASGRAKVAAPSASDDIAIKQTVDDHNAVTNPHSATSAATASRLVLRDASGRAQFADPAAASDAATRGYVDTLNPYYVASDSVILSLPAVFSSLSGYFKKITIKNPGTYRIKGEFGSGTDGQTGSFYVMATIGKDPKTTGDILQQFSSTSSTYAAFSVDIMTQGNCLIYMYVNGSPGVSVRNVTLCGTQVAVNPVTLSGVE